MIERLTSTDVHQSPGFHLVPHRGHYLGNRQETIQRFNRTRLRRALRSCLTFGHCRMAPFSFRHPVGHFRMVQEQRIQE